MNFSQALNLLQSSRSVRRQSWPEGVFVYYRLGSADIEPFLAKREQPKKVSVWLPNTEELFATDWEDLNA